MENAPFFADLAEGPEGGAAYWLMTSDNLRIRAGLWPVSAAKGTVLLFPGRTEYVEKYGRSAADLTARGYATLTVDWRGQGLADRLTGDLRIGHVHDFTDYQLDVAALVEAAKALDVPRPWYLIAHSMGGCIGLRAVMEGLPVQAAAFSAPMWGLKISPVMRPAAWALSWAGSLFGFGQNFAPGTTPDSYVMVEPFADNKLTTDPDMYEYMVRHGRARPELELGGPSLRWLHESLMETRALARLPSPDLPCLTFLGTNERIVDIARIERHMAHWPGGELVRINGAEHEVLMETADTRARIFDQCDALFARHRETPVTARSA